MNTNQIEVCCRKLSLRHGHFHTIHMNTSVFTAKSRRNRRKMERAGNRAWCAQQHLCNQRRDLPGDPKFKLRWHRLTMRKDRVELVLVMKMRSDLAQDYSFEALYNLIRHLRSELNHANSLFAQAQKFCLP